MPGVTEGGMTVQSIINQAEDINKRTVVVLRRINSTESYQSAYQAQTALSQAGFPVYPSFERAANAISKFVQYQHTRPAKPECKK